MKPLFLLLVTAANFALYPAAALAHDDCLPNPTENEVEGCGYTQLRAAELANALNFYAAGHRDGGEIARLTLGWNEQDDARQIEERRQQREQH